MYKENKNKRGGLEWHVCFYIVVLVATIVSFGLKCIPNKGSDIVYQVEKAERVASGKSSKYLIFTKEETFEITDNLWRWNSSDLYGRIDSGKCYRFKTVGYRNPLFSEYRNIMEAENAPCKKENK